MIRRGIYFLFLRRGMCEEERKENKENMWKRYGGECWL
jgi:hypothetical protein